MKQIKLFLLTLFFAGTGFANALISIEVVPFRLEAGVEVMGVHVAASGKRAAQNAVILSGAVAQDVAQGAGIVLDTTTHSLLLTGAEVTSLVGDALVGINVAGRTVFIQSANFAADVIDMTFNAVDTGAFVVIAIAGGMSEVAMNITRAIGNVAESTVILVTYTGAAVLSTGANVLGATINTITGVLRGILGGIFGF